MTLCTFSLLVIAQARYTLFHLALSQAISNIQSHIQATYRNTRTKRERDIACCGAPTPVLRSAGSFSVSARCPKSRRTPSSPCAAQMRLGARRVDASQLRRSLSSTTATTATAAAAVVCCAAPSSPRTLALHLPIRRAAHHGYELLSQPHAPQSFARRAWRPGRRLELQTRLSTMPCSQGALRRRVAMLALQEDRLRVLRSCLTSRRPASSFF